MSKNPTNDTLATAIAAKAFRRRSFLKGSAAAAVVIASHDLALVKRMKKRVLVIDKGRLMDDISPEELADE